MMRIRQLKWKFLNTDLYKYEKNTFPSGSHSLCNKNLCR